MAIEVVVGPSLVTINRGDTFVLSETDGCTTACTDQRFYSRDTPYVSNYEIFADGERWILQNSGASAYYASLRDGSGRVGEQCLGLGPRRVRLSPLGTFNDMGDDNPEVTLVNHRDPRIRNSSSAAT
jgi:hypothetical protein